MPAPVPREETFIPAPASDRANRLGLRISQRHYPRKPCDAAVTERGRKSRIWKGDAGKRNSL